MLLYLSRVDPESGMLIHYRSSDTEGVDSVHYT